MQKSKLMLKQMTSKCSKSKNKNKRRKRKDLFFGH